MSQVSNNEEIDLFALLEILNNRKKTLLAFVAIFTLIALAVAFILPEKWTSISYVRGPTIKETQDYINKYRELGRIIGTEKLNSTAGNPNKQLTTLTTEDISQLFSTFLETAADINDKRNFLQSTDYYKKLTQDSTDKNQKARVLEKLESDLVVDVPDDKKKQLQSFFTFRFSAQTAEDAQKVLSDYINHINLQAIDIAQTKLSDLVSSHITWRKNELIRMKVALQAGRENWIRQLEDAIASAKTAGIKEFRVLRPVVDMGEVNTSSNNTIEINTANVPELYMQGERILTALLKTAKETDLVYPLEYRQLQYELKQLEPLQNDLKNIQSYKFLLSPTLPTHKDSPKRALILIAGVLLGFVIGAIYILLSNVLSSKTPSSYSSSTPRKA